MDECDSFLKKAERLYDYKVSKYKKSNGETF